MMATMPHPDLARRPTRRRPRSAPETSPTAASSWATGSSRPPAPGRGVVIELDEHLERLRESATTLALHLPVPDEALADGIAELLAAEGLEGTGRDGDPVGDAALRITVSRGPIEKRGLLPPGFEDVAATIAIQAWPYAPPPAELLERGVRAIPSAVRRDPGSPLAGVSRPPGRTTSTRGSRPPGPAPTTPSP